MITIRPSNEDPGGMPPEAAPDSDEHQEQTPPARIRVVWIPATLVAGLLIAAIYLGGRIVTAHPRAKTPARAVNAAPHAVPVQPPVPSPVAPPVIQPPVVVDGEPIFVKSQALKSEAKPEPKLVAKPEAKPQLQAKAEAEPLKPASKRVGPEASPIAGNTIDAVPMITPQSGERYIQVGALNLEATRRFVQRLRNEKLEPHVAPGPTPELLRVLIGPFDDRDALTERKTQLQTQGIDSFVRKY